MGALQVQERAVRGTVVLAQLQQQEVVIVAPGLGSGVGIVLDGAFEFRDL